MVCPTGYRGKLRARLAVRPQSDVTRKRRSVVQKKIGISSTRTRRCASATVRGLKRTGKREKPGGQRQSKADCNRARIASRRAGGKKRLWRGNPRVRL